MILGHVGRPFEHQFFWMASIFLGCRLEVCGGRIEGRYYDFAGAYCGMVDYAWSMKRLCEKAVSDGL